MPFFTFPRSAVLVEWIVGFYRFQTIGTYKYPLLRLIDANSIQNIIRLLTPITGLGSNSLYWHINIANYFLPFVLNIFFRARLTTNSTLVKLLDVTHSAGFSR